MVKSKRDSRPPDPSSAVYGACNGKVAAYEIVEHVVPTEKTIRLGSLTRTSIMSQYGRRNQGDTTMAFAGKDSSGVPLSGHSHSFYVPTDEDMDGMLDHVYVVRDSGFDARELAAIRAVSAMNSPYDKIRVHVKPCTHVLDSAIFAQNCLVWESLSPFLLNRHVKHRRDHVIDSPESQVRLELKRRNATYRVQRVSAEADIAMACGIKPRQFISSRRRQDASRPAFKVILKFEKPINGPLFLGYGCHFGMGVFVPATRARFV